MSQHKGRAFGPSRLSSVQLEELDWSPLETEDLMDEAESIQTRRNLVGVNRDRFEVGEDKTGDVWARCNMGQVTNLDFGAGGGDLWTRLGTLRTLWAGERWGQNKREKGQSKQLDVMGIKSRNIINANTIDPGHRECLNPVKAIQHIK